MSTALIAVIVVVAVVVIAAIAFAVRRNQQGGTGRAGLRHRFGPEYDRVVAQHGGDTERAEAELRERVERYGELTPRPLSAEERAAFTADWTTVQQHFVDSPAGALNEADTLLARLARETGFPDSGFDEQADALSVHHGSSIEGYRQLHAAASGPAAAQDTGTTTDTAKNAATAAVSTEQQRTALLAGRKLFQELMSDSEQATTDANARTNTSDDADADVDAKGGRRTLGRIPVQQRHGA